MMLSKTKGQNIGYIRVSTADQNPDRQYKAFEDKSIVLDKVFTDYASGRTDIRPQWQACEGYLRDGDALYVESIDRMSRSLVHFFAMLKRLNDKGVTIVLVNSDTVLPPVENFEQLSAVEKFRLTIFAAVAEFQVNVSSEIRREGIIVAKAKGKYKGRKSPLRGETLDQFKEALEAPKICVADLARKFQVCPATIHNWRKKLKTDGATG